MNFQQTNARRVCDKARNAEIFIKDSLSVETEIVKEKNVQTFLCLFRYNLR